MIFVRALNISLSTSEAADPGPRFMCILLLAARASLCSMDTPKMKKEKE